MIRIFAQDDQLLLQYEADQFNDVPWVDEKLESEGSVTLRRTFTFKHAALVNEEVQNDGDINVRTFVLAMTDGDYYKIDKDILGLKHDLRISKQISLSHQTFIANRGISVFRKIGGLIDEPIFIGGDADSAIPLGDFEVLLKNFPTSTELTHYAHARIAGVLKDYLGTMSDAQKKLDAYLNRKRTIPATSRVEFLAEYEPQKFEYVRDELRRVLEDAESYTEKDWQKLIAGFLLLIFPKYIAVLENLQIKDFYSDPAKIRDRYIDLTLVDASGTIDIIEIKRPFANCLLSRNKYRDNYTPRIELSGSVMQVEKYIFHLNKWGRAGEIEILKKRQSELPANFEVKITNPQAMIILGRDHDFANDQKFDFEIIKRKYGNIIDIMTYDDLLRRLDNIISMIRTNYSKLTADSSSSSNSSAK
jgi:hypothetical protein